MLSPEELPSLCDRNNTVNFVESTRLSTSGALAGDSTFIKISSNGCYLENDAGCTMNSFSNSHSCDEKHRYGSLKPFQRLCHTVFESLYRMQHFQLCSC